MSKHKSSGFKPDFIGIGMRKSGTTWLAKMLQSHPEIGFSRDKEISFFNNVWALVDKPHKSKLETEGIELYEKYFNKGKIVGEWSVTYAPDPNVAKRIKNYFPNVKILVSLRDPVERTFSFYKYAKYVRLIDNSKTFEDAIKRHSDYIEGSMYYPQLKRYFDLFPKENIKVVLLDDIVKDNRSVIRDLYSFLGVNSSFMPEGIDDKTNVAREVKHKFIFKSLRSFLLLMRIFVPKSLRPGARVSGKKMFRRLIVEFTSEPVGVDSLREETRKNLLEVFKPDIERTAKLIGRDLSAWYV